MKPPRLSGALTADAALKQAKALSEVAQMMVHSPTPVEANNTASTILEKFHTVKLAVQRAKGAKRVVRLRLGPKIGGAYDLNMTCEKPTGSAGAYVHFAHNGTSFQVTSRHLAVYILAVA